MGLDIAYVNTMYCRLEHTKESKRGATSVIDDKSAIETILEKQKV